MIINDHEIERYSRQMLLTDFSLTGQARLKQSSVLVIGAGGLGTPVLSYLAGAGIGKIGIVDGDKIELSNLHRQVMYTENDLGKKKAEVLASRIQQLNSDISVVVHETNLRAANAKELIKPFDIVVDCTDNYDARYLINDTCVELEKPFVYGSLYKTQGQFALLNWKHGPTYRCIYPNIPGIESRTNCNEAGVVGTLCGVIGSYQANLVIQSIVAPEKDNHSVLHVLDINTNDLFKFEHKRNYNYEEKPDIMRSISEYDFFKIGSLFILSIILVYFAFIIISYLFSLIFNGIFPLVILKNYFFMQGNHGLSSVAAIVISYSFYFKLKNND